MARSHVPGGPVAWSREMHWAMTAASSRGRWGNRTRVFPFRHGPFLVTLGAPVKPYGRSLHTSGYITHIADEIYLMWPAGRPGRTAPVAWAIRWRCGARTRWFRLLDEPDSTLCVVCPLDHPPRERKRS